MAHGTGRVGVGTPGSSGNQKNNQEAAQGSKANGQPEILFLLDNQVFIPRRC